MRAFLFPGQGSQYPGMGKDLWSEFPICRSVFEEADEAIGFRLSQLCFEGPKEQLLLTEFTQPAILTVSVALLRALSEHGFHPEFVAGHSLGEYTALVAARSLRFDDAVRLVRMRGRFMQEAVPRGEGAMAAILGLEIAKVEELCQRYREDQVVEPANLNSPDQVVIAGHQAAVQRVGSRAREVGARRVIELPVSAPFHCSLMRPAQERLQKVLEEIAIADLQVPLVNNVEAAIITRSGEARQGLIRQVAAPVRWVECVERLAGEGVESFVEVGPGRVLTGLARRIAPQAHCLNIENVEHLRAHV